MNAKVAVVLNGNARSVTHRTITELGKLITHETLFVSRSLEQSRFIARQVVKGGFDVVLSGGGDGTFTRVVTDIMSLKPKRPPAFGALRLGTGNAIATALGVGKNGVVGWRRELAHVAKSPDRVLLPLIVVEGQLTPFAGCGVDALILQDYRRLHEQVPSETIKSLLEGPIGYGCSIATRSIWKYIAKPLPEVIIRNEGDPAVRIDLDGSSIGRPVPKGETIYRGPATMAAAATIPFCGFGVRLYPQAGKRGDRFHLRVGQTGVHNVIAKLPHVLRGQFEGDKLFDFYCTAISIQVPHGTVFQAGGDLLGSRTSIRFGIDQVEGIVGATGKTLLPRYTALKSHQTSQNNAVAGG